jgi:methionyl-tRNA formyltransferase
MRLVMMGTGPFAVPTFRELFATSHTVVALVTSPLRPARGPDPPPGSFIRDVAREHGTPVFDPEAVNSPESRERLRSYQADLLVTCDYGQILAVETLATARLGGINLHASLLPKYRGAAPINWALYHGETETGVTVIHMTPQVDAGPCIAQLATPIGPEETAPEIEIRLAALGAELACQTIDALAVGPMQALPQDPTLASKAPRLKKTDGAIDWSRPAAAISNQVRAFEPWPKCYTYWHRAAGAPMRWIVGPIKVADAPSTGEPGTVLEAAGDHILIATGHQVAQLTELQPAGKRPLGIEAFLRGYRVRAGERLGPEG